MKVGCQLAALGQSLLHSDQVSTCPWGVGGGWGGAGAATGAGAGASVLCSDSYL